jgi:hypothetical protein
MGDIDLLSRLDVASVENYSALVTSTLSIIWKKAIGNELEELIAGEA